MHYSLPYYSSEAFASTSEILFTPVRILDDDNDDEKAFKLKNGYDSRPSRRSSQHRTNENSIGSASRGSKMTLIRTSDDSEQNQSEPIYQNIGRYRTKSSNQALHAANVNNSRHLVAQPEPIKRPLRFSTADNNFTNSIKNYPNQPFPQSGPIQSSLRFSTAENNFANGIQNYANQPFQHSELETIDRTAPSINYQQNISVLYLKPPTPPPVPIIVKEVRLPQEKEQDPLRVFVRPPQPPTPPPIFIRERPPPMPSQKPIRITKILPPLSKQRPLSVHKTHDDRHYYHVDSRYYLWTVDGPFFHNVFGMGEKLKSENYALKHERRHLSSNNINEQMYKHHRQSSRCYASSVDEIYNRNIEHDYMDCREMDLAEEAEYLLEKRRDKRYNGDVRYYSSSPYCKSADQIDRYKGCFEYDEYGKMCDPDIGGKDSKILYVETITYESDSDY
ncbi:hypothetical protein ACOME3_006729 [Neoechinorhynchus agilis]